MTKRDRSMIEALDAMGERLDDALDARDRYYDLYREAAHARDYWRKRAEQEAQRADYAESKNRIRKRDLKGLFDKTTEMQREMPKAEVIHGKETL